MIRRAPVPARALRRCLRGLAQPGLRLRLWFGAAALAALVLGAAALAVYGLQRTQSHAAEALAAQARVEAYGSLAAQVNAWMLGWLMQPAPDQASADGVARQVTAAPPPNPAPVQAALDRIDRLIAEDVAAATDAANSAQRARQSVSSARLRGLFAQLSKAFVQSPPGTPGGDAAIAFYLAQGPAVVSAQIEQELWRREAALVEMTALQSRLRGAAYAVAAAAVMLLLAFYLLLMRPLFARLAQMSQGSEGLLLGQLPTRAGGHDELGLMLARLRQMARRIDRGRSHLAQDRARLEGIVSGRTAALSAANEQLGRIDANRRRFFADVGHELRTPLTVIMGEAELGQRHGDPLVRAAFDTILTRARRLFSRIEDILRIARSETGQLELARQKVMLDQLVAAAQADLAPVLRRAGISVHADVPALAVAGDAEWLRQVLAGILENAAKYAGRGAEVHLSASASGQSAELVIRDTGPGLAPALRAQVFERFSRGTSTAAVPGFGVGLALAAWVVEASGGRLSLLPEGQPGLGFVIELPLWEEP